jgi:hypothetical protein
MGRYDNTVCYERAARMKSIALQLYVQKALVQELKGMLRQGVKE